MTYPTCNACGVSATQKCGGCRSVSYCSVDCQRANWQQHKAVCALNSIGARRLFEQMADRMGKDRTNYPYEDFKIDMMSRSSTDKRTLQEQMEDWLEGPYTIAMDRKKLLRRLFQEKGLVWSQDVFSLYDSWSTDQTGNRFQKMLHFINEHRALF